MSEKATKRAVALKDIRGVGSVVRGEMGDLKIHKDRSGEEYPFVRWDGGENWWGYTWDEIAEIVVRQ